MIDRIPKQDVSSAAERTLQNLFHKSGDTVSSVPFLVSVLLPFPSFFGFLSVLFLFFFLSCFIHFSKPSPNGHS